MYYLNINRLIVSGASNDLLLNPSADDALVLPDSPRLTCQAHGSKLYVHVAPNTTPGVQLTNVTVTGDLVISNVSTQSPPAYLIGLVPFATQVVRV